MTNRKRGAPRGNHNAFKHGFYSAAFRNRERRILSQPSAADLATEIELLRVANYRFLHDLGASAGPLDHKTQLAALRAVNLSVLSIKRLLQARSLLPLVSGDEPFPPDDPEALPEISPGPSDAPYPSLPAGT